MIDPAAKAAEWNEIFRRARVEPPAVGQEIMPTLLALFEAMMTRIEALEEVNRQRRVDLGLEW